VLGLASGFITSATSTSFTLPFTHADMSTTVDTGYSQQQTGMIYAEADNFELHHCGFNENVSAGNYGVGVGVYATPTSTANNAKIHDNIFVDPYPSNGLGRVGDWAASTLEAAGTKTAVVVGGTKYLMVATTGGTTSATAPTWSTGLSSTTTDGSVVWTNNGSFTSDNTVGVRVVGWDAAHTADYAAIYNNVVSYPFIDVAVATYASHADLHDNWLYEGEHFDVNGDYGVVDGTSLHDNWIIGGTGGSWVQDGQHTLVAHNHFLNYSSNGQAAVNYSDPYLGYTNTDNISSGNQFVGSASSGPGITVTQETMGLTIAGDNISYAGVEGIAIYGNGLGTSGAWGTHIKNVVLKDNGQKSPGTGTYCGIQLHTNAGADNRILVDISNSTAVDDQPVVYGTLAANTTQAYAVCSDSNEQPNWVR
jgi:hypothetical protein